MFKVYKSLSLFSLSISSSAEPYIPPIIQDPVLSLPEFQFSKSESEISLSTNKIHHASTVFQYENLPNTWTYGLYFRETEMESDKKHPISGRIYNPKDNGCSAIPGLGPNSDFDAEGTVIHFQYQPITSNTTCNYKIQLENLAKSTKNNITNVKAIIWTGMQFNMEYYEWDSDDGNAVSRDGLVNSEDEIVVRGDTGAKLDVIQAETDFDAGIEDGIDDPSISNPLALNTKPKIVNPIPKDFYQYLQNVYNPSSPTSTQLMLFRSSYSRPIQIPYFHPSSTSSDSTAATDNLEDDKPVEIWRYRRLSLMKDPTFFILIVFATCVVALSAYMAAFRPSPERAHSSSVGSGNNREVDADAALSRAQPFTLPMVFSFFIFASLILTVLFFTVQYLVPIILVFYCMAAISSSSHLFSVYIWNYCKCARFCITSRHTRPKLYKYIGRIRMSDLISWLPGIISALLFLYYHAVGNSIAYKRWIFQNLLALLICCCIQCEMRISNLRLGTVFLIMMFFFDIFWVFYSDRIFGKSVMIVVATGGSSSSDNASMISNSELPMLIEFTSFWDDLNAKVMLGLGDVALPGFLITYNLHCDRRNEKTWAFICSLVGYFVGLGMAVVGMVVYQQGQPALLYLVPCVLVGTFIGARAEFSRFWDGSALDRRKRENLATDIGRVRLVDAVI